MELRKDPITRSWVVIREGEPGEPPPSPCPYCPGNENLTAPALLALPENSSAWQVRVFPHFDPLFRIEGSTDRAADGLYDKMRMVGAHEVIVELPEHDRTLSHATDAEIARVLEAYALRVADLKGDIRFKYISVFKNSGAEAGQELPHSHSQLTATTFVPRRVLHELRSARDYFQLKERCLFCDMVRQELRQQVRLIETTPNYVAYCPFAPRNPYEMWILPRRHHHSFEDDYLHSSVREELARLLRHTLQRLERLSGAYHFILHTCPNRASSLRGVGYWESLEDDYHWHLEFIPVLPRKPRPYIAKEVYFTTVTPEAAAARLREFPVED